MTQLDLREVTLVGHSMGCCEIARYLARHSASRIARVALISPTMPFILRTADNPDGVPRIVLDTAIAQYLAGELDEAGTEQAIADGWNQITDEVGKDKQLAAYVASLGVQR